MTIVETLWLYSTAQDGRMAYEKPTVKRLGSFAEFTKQLKQVGSADGIILITNEEDIPLTNYSG